MGARGALHPHSARAPLPGPPPPPPQVVAVAVSDPPGPGTSSSSVDAREERRLEGRGEAKRAGHFSPKRFPRKI